MDKLMKNIISAMFIIAMLLTSVQLVCLASTSTTILPNGYYVPLSSPHTVISKDDTTVIVDDQAIHIVDRDTISSYPLFNPTISHAIVGNYLYFTYPSGDSDTEVGILSLSDLSYSTTTVPDCDVLLLSDGDTLYYCAGSKLYVFDTHQTIFTYSKLADAISLDMADDLVYISTVDGIYTYRISNGEKAQVLPHTSTSIEIVDNCVYMASGYTLVVYDIDSEISSEYTLTYPVEGVESISYNNSTSTLYLLNKQADTVYSYRLTPQFELIDTIGSHGVSKDRLNSPNDIYASENNLYVADTLNNRILCIDATTDEITNEYEVPTPQYVAVHNGIIYCSDGTNIYSISDTERKTYTRENISVKAMSIDAGGTLYVLTDSAIWYLKDDELVLYTTITDAESMAFSPIGYTLYVATDDTVYRYLTHNTVIDTIILDDTDTYGDILDIEVDHLGNIYLLRVSTSTTISKLKKSQGNYTLQNIYDISPTIPNATYNKYCIHGEDILMISTNSHSMIRVNDTSMDIATSSSIDDVVRPNIDTADKVPLDNPVSIKTLSANSYIYTNPTNDESIRKVSASTQVIVLDSYTEYDGYSYILYEGNCVFAKTDMLSSVSDGTPPMTDALTSWSNTKLYKYPIQNDDYLVISLPRHTKVTCTGTAYGYDNGKWLSVEYMDKTYYIKASGTLVPQSDELEVARYDAKISAESLGGYVNVYLWPNDTSEVLTTLVDGTEVLTYQLIKSSDEYTKICVEVDGLEIVGYVNTSRLSTDSVTTPQLIAVLIILILSIATTITYLVIKKRRS